MTFSGKDVLDIGATRVGQDYVFGASVPLDNPNWRGPWDCAEFTSWCAYQAYGLIFGAGTTANVARAEPYSGSWYSDAHKRGTVIDVSTALRTPGAAVIRAPARGKIGHVAFAMGDGDRTLEARGRAFGVGIFAGAATRGWSIGCFLPGVDYGQAAAMPVLAQQKPRPAALPEGMRWLRSPNFRGGDIVALQRALAAKRIDPGPIDGVFGPMTNAALLSFQAREGIEVDGVVGSSTAAALGLGFPIPVAASDVAVQRAAASPPGPTAIPLPAMPGGFDGIVAITRSGKRFTARTASGFTFAVGSSTSFTDDMNRVGLYQAGTDIADSLKFGTYAAADYVNTFGVWAHFIQPTLTAEGNARFATLNTYDRAAFTFGAPQLAAHTPNANLILLLRGLLGLPDADRHFPELTLRPNGAGQMAVHLAKGAGFEDLENEVLVRRPNGRQEVQLAKLMAFLNPSPTAIDGNELSAAARLINWLRLDPQAKALQIAVFIGSVKGTLAEAKTKLVRFTGEDWRIALWIADIRHQGRGTYAEMAAALASASPEGALRAIGASRYGGRVSTVAAGIDNLAASGVMKGFTV